MPSARRNEAATSWSTSMPPSRSLAAIRRPATPSAIPARSPPVARQREPVAAAGLVSTVSNRAGSSTVRAIGPTGATVPNGGHGQAGTRRKVGLRPRKPAEGARDADRSAAVGAEAERPHPGRRRDRRAAARAAGCGRVPRVAGDPAQRAVGDPLPAQLGRGGLAGQHRAGAAQPGERARPPNRRGTAVVRAAPRRQPAHQRQVLDAAGTPSSGPHGSPRRAARLRGPRGREGAVVVDQAERADGRSSGRSAPARRRRPRPATARAAGVQLQEVAGRTQARRGGVHAVLPRRRPWRSTRTAGADDVEGLSRPCPFARSGHAPPRAVRGPARLRPATVGGARPAGGDRPAPALRGVPGGPAPARRRLR